jgi:hypothetical protein
MWCGARFGYTADCGCCDPQTGNACPQCGSQSWGWFATAPNNSLITARDAGTEESYALDWESRLAAQYPLPLEGLQGRIHCIDLLGDGFFLGSQSLDAGQLLIDAKLALRQLLERRLQVLFNASVWCRRWGAPAWACGCWGCRCNRRFVRVAVLDVLCQSMWGRKGLTTLRARRFLRLWLFLGTHLCCSYRYGRAGVPSLGTCLLAMPFQRGLVSVAEVDVR